MITNPRHRGHSMTKKIPQSRETFAELFVALFAELGTLRSFT